MSNVPAYCARLATGSRDGRGWEWTTYDTVMLVLLLALVCIAVSFAVSCGAGPVEYVVAVLFPVEYTIIKLVTDCKGAQRVVFVEAG